MTRLGYHLRLRFISRALGPVSLLSCFLIPSHASPLRLQKRANPPPSIWTPAVIFVVIFVGLAALLCLGRSLLRRARASRAANTTTTTTNSIRSPTGEATVITADQLAGTINGDAAGANNANPTRRPRRARRPRRTPSQMSVTSLPEYMKEPGDEEVVIFRGQSPDQEGPTQPAASVVADHPSDDEDSRDHESPAGESEEQYAPMPTSPHTMPLLQEEEDSEPGRGTGRERGNNTIDISRPDRIHQASSISLGIRSSNYDTSSISLTRFDSNNTQASNPLARAPPAYFEVLGDVEPLHTYYPPASSSTLISSTSSTAPLLGSSPLSSSSETPTSIPTSTLQNPSAPASANRNRRSGFRTFFNRMSIGNSGSGGSHHHQRSESANTTATGRPSSSFARPTSPHSANHSITSLTSPSMISLNSISAPLTHTASRTKFTFPNSKTTGLPTMTPEQLKIIASRDAIGRFGLPYGPDAVAFAASMSKVELGVGGEMQPPPPGFEDVPTEASGSGLISASSNTIPMAQVQMRAEEGNGEPGGLVREPSALSTVTVRPREPVSSANEGNPSSFAASLHSEDGSGSRSRSSQPTSRTPSQDEDSTNPIPISQTPVLTNNNNASDSEAALSKPPSSSASFPPPSVNSTSSKPTFSESGQAHSPSKLLAAAAAAADNNLVRAESRSSVYSSRTYATAVESLRPDSSSSSSSSSLGPSSPGGGGTGRSGVGDEEEESEVDEPMTPRLGLGRPLAVM